MRRVWYLKLKHPMSGRTSVKKFSTRENAPRKVKEAYYGSSHHFNTEAEVMQVSRRRRELLSARARAAARKRRRRPASRGLYFPALHW